MLERAGVLSIAFLLLIAPTAGAGQRVEIHPSGALTITWHGDPARGCAEAGVCDLAGSVTLAPDIGGDQVSESPGNSVLAGIGTRSRTRRCASCAARPTIRSGSASTASGPSSCRWATAARGPRASSSPASACPFSGALPANRCGGPLGADLTRALPAVSVRARDLRRPDVKLDFSGRRPFASGAFSGEVSSALVFRAHVSRVADRIDAGRRPRPVRSRKRRFAAVDLEYRMTPGPDPLAIAFRGLDGRGARPSTPAG